MYSMYLRHGVKKGSARLMQRDGSCAHEELLALVGLAVAGGGAHVTDRPVAGDVQPVRLFDHTLPPSYWLVLAYPMMRILLSVAASMSGMM